MEYTINALAKLSGVSTRTLRYYDEIELLKPERVADNGYRIYGQVQVDMLQQILFYRELGMSLKEIKTIIVSEDFDKRAALEDHLNLLTNKKIKIENLINNVKKTIQSIEGETIMSNEEKFECFKKQYISDNEKHYGKEIREKYGEDSINSSNQKVLNMSREQWQNQENLSNQIAELLKQALKRKDPSCDEAQKACELHREWICMFWKDGMYSKEAHIGLAEMYVQDERFKEYYEKIGEGCAKFFRDAINIYCK